MNTAYISTAYLGPIQLYTKLLAYDKICLETQENYLKQTYRNRCIIAAANGPQALTVPIVKPDALKCLTKDIRSRKLASSTLECLGLSLSDESFFRILRRRFCSFLRKEI